MTDKPIPDAAPAEVDSQLHQMLYDEVQKLKSDVHTMKGNLSANTALTQMLAEQNDALKTVVDGMRGDTVELLEIFRALRGGFTVLGWLGNIAKWAAGVGVALIGLWIAIKGGPHA